MNTKSDTAQRNTGGYTLIEMMIVMVILIVVMALVAPVIGNARNAAKRTTTAQLLNNLAQASQQFEMSERRMPGYFTETDMGSTTNQGRGFTSVNNVLLDLAGGIVAAAGNNNDTIQVGPTTQSTVLVRTALIGAPTQTKGVMNKGYFTPDPKYFALQDSPSKKNANWADHFLLPDLIDGFGQPILAWRQDIEPSSDPATFASMNSATRASFYWASNAAFLSVESLGRKEVDQRNIDDGANGSMIGTSGDLAPTDIIASMHGILGHPAFPLPYVRPTDVAYPAAARGKLIFHSAGTDGSFLGAKDRGGTIATAAGVAGSGHVKNVIDYRPAKDPLDNFDDVIGVSGN